MSMSRADAVRRWYHWNLERPRDDWHAPPGLIGGVWGMSFLGRRILESSSTSLATISRTRLELGEVPLVRLTLPNQLTIGRHRLIRETVRKEGAMVLSVPRQVLRNADIQYNTIQVVDSHSPRGPFRAEEQLIKAEVVSTANVWENDWFSNRPYRRTKQSIRTSYFLSGFDRNERQLSYFFCELPPGAEPKTVKEAYECLKPESVKIAERQRLRVKRQGDMFLIPVPRFRPPEGAAFGNGYLHGTNHMAAECAHVEGLTYARGKIMHRPGGRRPDHKTLHLGRRWYLCVKNTVPVTG